MAEVNPGPDPEAVNDDSIKPIADDSKGCLQASMKIGNLVFNVYLDETGLSWVKRGKPKDKAVTIPVDEILGVSKITGKKSDGCEVIGFTISCIRHMKKNILKREMVQFLCDSEEGTKWSEKIQLAIEQVKSQPKRLLVIINPESGSKSGRKVYDSKVAGLLKQANIEADVIVTERAHHCEEVLTAYDLSSVNGIVLVGGDGLYHEAVNGLQQRLTKEAGLDVNNPSTCLPKVPVPIGLIPTGTGNGIAAGSYGCIDVETAALSIIKGKTVDGNLIGAYSQGELIRYAGLLVGYGVWGDLIYAAETNRSIGRLRYATAMSTILIKRHRQMNLNCEYLLPAYTPQTQEQGKSHSEPQREEKSHHEQQAEEMSHSEPQREEKSHLEQQAEGMSHSEPKTEEESHSKQLSATQEAEQSGLEDPLNEEGSDQLNSDEQTKESLQEKSNIINTNWKTIQGVYTGVMLFVGDYWSYKEKTPATGDCTRLILNKPSGGFKLFLFLVKLLTRHPQALENNLTDNMQIKEVKLTVDSPSEENTDNGKRERILDLDGEIFHLKQPECHIVFHPKTVQLFGAPRESWTSNF